MIKKLLLGLLALAVLLMLFVYQRYGGGHFYQDVTTEPLYPAEALELVVSYPEPIGNVAVSATGRLFFTVHPESRPAGARLLEWRDGEAVPYPPGLDQHALFDTPLGIAIDRQDRLWVIDPGNHGVGSPRLQAFDLNENKPVVDYHFPGKVAPLGSFLQDLQIDSQGDTVFIADVSIWNQSPALVVYDVRSNSARRVLERHPSVVGQDWIIRTPARDMVFLGGLFAMKPGVDGIAIDRQDHWLYYGAMSHDTLYRVPVADLRNTALSDEQLAETVEAVGRKPLNDGLSTDIEGNVYITDAEHGAVLRMRPDGALQTLVKSTKVRWADALSFGPDNWLYLADSDIPDLVLQSKSAIAAKGPFYIFRFKNDKAGIAGQ